MTDLATLVIEIDSTQAKDAAGDLDKLTSAGKRTEAEVARVAGSASSASQQAAEMARQAQAAAGAVVRSAAGVRGLGTATQLSAHHMQNLGFQVQDLAVQLASGGNPLMALAQQGSQMYGVFQQAGEGAGALAYQVGVLIGRFLPLGAAIGVGYAALKLLQDTLNDAEPSNAFIQSLGLTDAEMKKLQATTITTGDLFTGLWKVIAERSGVDKSITDFKSLMVHAFADSLAGAGRAMAGIYGEVVGTYRAVTKVWNDLPAVFGATFARATNAAAAQLERFINSAIDGINSLAKQANALIGTDLFGSIGHVSLGRMEADFSKSFGNIRSTISGEIASATVEASGYMQGFMSDVVRAAIASSSANDAIAKGTNKAAGAHRDRAKAADEEARSLRHLFGIQEEISKSLLGSFDMPERMGLNISPSLMPDAKFIETPWQQWAKTVPQDAAEINMALQSIQMQGFDGLAAAIGGVIAGTTSLKDAFSSLAQGIIQQIIQMTVRMLIFRALSSAFGLGSAGGGANSLGGSLAIAGARARGGPVAGGKPYLVGERGPELFVPRGHGTIVPNGAANGNAPVNVTVNVNAKDAVLTQSVKGWITEGIYQAAPTIVAASQRQTTRTLTRRKIS